MIVAYSFLRTFLTATITVLISSYFSLSEGYWLVLSATLLSQIHIIDVFKKNIYFMLVIGFVITCHISLSNWLSNQIILLSIYLFIVAFLSSYLALKKTAYYLPVIFINLLGFLSAGIHVGYQLSITRFENTIVGTAVAILVCSILWPPSIKNTVNQLLRNYFFTMDQFQKIIFLLYSKRDYKENSYFYEKELNQKRFNVIKTVQLLQKIGSKIDNSDKKMWRIINHISAVFEIMTMLSNLRYRVQDHSLFEVYEKEFNYFSNTTTLIFREFMMQLNSKSSNQPIKNIKQLTDSILSSVHSFEDIYRSTLQVVTSEPLIYLIFIQNMKDFCKDITLLADDWVAE